MPAQPGTFILWLVQMGTVVWLNTLVPHTGKAVCGVCPKAVHADCAAALLVKHVIINNAAINLLHIIYFDLYNRPAGAPMP